MRRSTAFMLATTVLTGGAVLSFLAVAVAQDASGPSTSGGSLPYISGKEPDKTPDERRGSAAKTQATSGSGSGSGERSTPAAAPSPSGEARQEPAATAKPAGGDRPRVIDLSQGRDKPAATPPEAPAAAAVEPKPEPTRRDEAVPGPQRATAEPPPPAAKPERAGSDEKPTDDTPKRAERKPPKPPARKATETVRKEPAPRSPAAGTLRRDAEPVDPYGRPLPRSAARDPRGVEADGRFARRAPQPGEGRYGRAEADDDSDYYVYRPRRWRDSYPYVYAYPEYRTAPGVMRPFSSSPRYYYVQPMGPGGGDNCHYHAFPGDGMRFHREIRCHWHEDAGDPSIRYVR